MSKVNSDHARTVRKFEAIAHRYMGLTRELRQELRELRILRQALDILYPDVDSAEGTDIAKGIDTLEQIIADHLRIHGHG